MQTSEILTLNDSLEMAAFSNSKSNKCLLASKLIQLVSLDHQHTV
jgi:hypothetical protein